MFPISVKTYTLTLTLLFMLLGMTTHSAAIEQTEGSQRKRTHVPAAAGISSELVVVKKERANDDSEPTSEILNRAQSWYLLSAAPTTSPHMKTSALLEAHMCFEAVLKRTQNLCELSNASFYSGHIALKLKDHTTLPRSDIALRLLAGLQCSTLTTIEHEHLREDLSALGIDMELSNNASYSSQQHDGSTHNPSVIIQREGALEPSIRSHHHSHVPTETPPLSDPHRGDMDTSEEMHVRPTREATPVYNCPLGVRIILKFISKGYCTPLPADIWKDLNGKPGHFIKYELLEGNPRQFRISVHKEKEPISSESVFFMIIKQYRTHLPQAVIHWLMLRDGDDLCFNRIADTYVVHQFSRTDTHS